jgi:orotate phosphoribosyltransferase
MMPETLPSRTSPPEGDREANLDPRTTIAADLLRIGAVVVRPEEPFTWASGRKAPVYTDNRLTLGHVDVRRRLTDAFVAITLAHGWRPDVIAGTATAGIPHAAWLAERLGLPLAYVRSTAKAHGRGNLVEGPVTEGQRVLLVEDLVSTGGSSLAAVAALRGLGADVVAVVAVFTYGLDDAARAFAASGVPLHALTDFDALAGQGGFSPEARASLHEWRRDPAAWSRAHGGAT